MSSDACDRARVAKHVGALRQPRFLRPTAQDANGLRWQRSRQGRPARRRAQIAAISETNRSGHQRAQMAAIAPGSPSMSARSDSRDF